LWLRLGSLYGHRWVSAYGADPSSPTGDTWAQCLAGISREELELGLAACMNRADPWPPSLPEFRCLCLGIPAWPAVRLEFAASDNQPRSPFTRMVAQHLDTWAFHNAATHEAQRMLHEAYDMAVESRLRGEPLPPVLTALPKPAPRQFTPAAPDVAKRHIEEINTMLGMAHEESTA